VSKIGILVCEIVYVTATVFVDYSTVHVNTCLALGETKPDQTYFSYSTGAPPIDIDLCDELITPKHMFSVAKIDTPRGLEIGRLAPNG
jgi:hypothetical protein